MSNVETPNCCKKPMELKAVTDGDDGGEYGYYRALHFQCNKCGKVETI